MPPSCTDQYPDLYTIPPNDGSAQSQIIAARNVSRSYFYGALRELLRKQYSFDPLAESPEKASDFAAWAQKDANAQARLLILGVAGTLMARNQTDPFNGRGDSATPLAGDRTFKLDGRTMVISPRFTESVVDAVKAYNSNIELFGKVFPVLQKEGTTGEGTPNKTVTVYAEQLAEVSRRLSEEHVAHTDPQINLRILQALSQAIGATRNGASSSIDIDLPALEAGTAVEIVPDNLKALSAIYFCAQLEEMKLFSVADKVTEHFMSGMLPITRGSGGERIYRYLRDGNDRFTEHERRSMYARAFGVAQGNANEAMPNREFQDLWIRFLSAVSLLNRQSTMETVKVTTQQALKSARDLSVNVSLHGYGIAHFAAVELQKLIRDVLDMLQHPDVVAAYGARDVWQLVDRVSQMYLGGAANTVRFRTMAQSGSRIMQWLAKQSPTLASIGNLPVGLFSQPELISEVEQWLAVTATTDQAVERYSEPMDMVAQPTIPFLPAQLQVPDVVRNAMQNVTNGIQLPNLPQA